MELHNVAGNSALEPKLNAQMQRAVRDELHEPLPTRLYERAQARVCSTISTRPARPR